MAEKNESSKPQTIDSTHSTLALQAWFSLAFWLSAGLLFEGLIGFRAPAYLQDSTRRELFRLAHAHGAILNMLLLIVAFYLKRDLITPLSAAVWSLRIGVILMPLGFLFGGLWHYESDPNPLVIAAPVGGLLIIFAVIAIGLSALKK